MSSNLVKTTDYGENQPVGNRAESRILFYFFTAVAVPRLVYINLIISNVSAEVVRFNR